MLGKVGDVSWDVTMWLNHGLVDRFLRFYGELELRSRELNWHGVNFGAVDDVAIPFIALRIIAVVTAAIIAGCHIITI